jgi:hypothetical protein
VIARDDVTCFVLAPRGRDLSAGCGAGVISSLASSGSELTPDSANGIDFAIDVHPALDRKIAALVAHRSQYALDVELLPHQVLGPLLRTEHFTVAG